MVADQALIDSGATENFMDKAMARRLGIGQIQMHAPKIVKNVDETENQEGRITHFCILHTTLEDKEKAQKFYITSLGQDQMILGYPWLHNYNLKIDWKEGKFEGEPLLVATANNDYWYTLAKKLTAAVEINKASISQEWANQEKHSQEEVTIPDKYKWHEAVFSEEGAKCFPPKRLKDMEIKLEVDTPKTINCKMYNLAEEESKIIKGFLNDNLAKGFILQSDSVWSTPVFFIDKTGGGKWPIFNYRRINAHTVKDVYPLPRIDYLFDQLHRTSLMTKFDVRDGYYNIQIKPESRWITAFKTPYRLYEPNVIPFRLCNAPAIFQCFMDRIFRPLKKKYPKYLHWYMDDILIATPDNRKLHREIVHQVLEVLEKESLFLKAKKCHFEQEEVNFLGYVISQGTIKVDLSKRHGLDEWLHQLKNVKEVWSTLGVLGYQRQFIPHFAHLAHPLNELLKKNKKFKWTEGCTQAVNALIKAVTFNPVLLRPDFKKPFVLEVDASQYATGAILYQQDDEEHWRPVGYYSKLFNEAERGYNIHDWELLAIVRGLEHWWHLLLSSPFKVTVISDHLNLKYYQEPQKINQHVARYLPKLGEYNLQIVHKLGKTNKVDLLSRW
jgi:RNase H-like domain found in reverse transcriptase/Reverse transcriptase (RNA-dependent DNA polymerase)